MLKIWLTWLQPSLGAFGIALVLFSALSASAAPTPTAVATTKAKVQQPAAVNGTTIDRELSLSGVSATPDFAVRQLAISTMMSSGVKSSNVAIKAPQFNPDALASFIAPTQRVQKLSARAKTTTPQFVKHSVTAAVATRSAQPKAVAPIVPGLFIGNSDVRLSSQFVPSPQVQAQSVGTKLIATTVPTAAMLATSAIADPFPVVLPQRMQGLRLTPEIGNIPTVQTAFKVQANDPISSIPAGLQQLLGNEPSRQPTATIAPVAKAPSTKTNALVALGQLISPEIGTQAATQTVAARGASLQLNTAQAYASVPKFEIPGVNTSNMVPIRQLQAAKPTNSVLTVKPVQKDLATAVTQRKRDYVALMSDRFLLRTKQSWETASRSNSLGGLILGSQSQPAAKLVTFLPLTGLTTPESKGLTVFNPFSIN
jgi:hypothetical protein